MAQHLKFTEKVSISSHLIELKDRMIKVFIVLAFFFGLCFYFKEFLLFWLEDPLPAKYKGHLIFISPTEPFFAHMKVSFMGALFISMPYILYQIWFFISPGLKVKEKKVTMMFVLFGTLFFLFGGAFCYFLVLPLGLKFLIGYGVDWYSMQVTIKLYFSFVVKLILAFAFAFQTPLIMVLLTKFGLINTIKMRMYRKWAFLGAFGLASVLTPPDIITQVLLGFPLYLLYEFGALVSAFFEDPKQREKVLKQVQLEKEMKQAKKEAAVKASSLRKKVKKTIKPKKKAG
ncbi:MAG: twin-arginine translocase subunit TatC [Nitrospinae bacterium]|nr:twin-arginine translocase subunit TatC [Nitrospinota bacterium]